MRADQVIAQLRAHESDLKRMGVDHLCLFGSVARDEATEASDVDLFFDYGDPHFSLVELIGVQQHLNQVLGRSADVMTRGSLHPVMREGIERTAMQIF